MLQFDESRFRSRVNAALERVRTILENTRKPQFAADVHHEYEDKYLLAEYLFNTTIAAQLNVLTAIGLSEKQLAELQEWAKTRSVTLRLKAEEHCKFLRKVVREVQSDTKHVSKSTLFGTSESYTVTKVTEYFWLFDVKYELLAFFGNEPDKAVVLQGRGGSVELKTSAESTPKPVSTVRPSIDVNITWLLQQLDNNHHAKFAIDRLAKSCHTPRRNDQVNDALSFVTNLHQWANAVHSYFTRDVFPVQVDHGLDLSTIKESSLFVPVLPLFEKQHKQKDEKKKQVVPVAYLGAFLNEQTRSMTEKFKELGTVFPSDKLITLSEAKLLVALLHLKQICQALAESIDYIEDMLYKQLVAAIGKEVSPVDFTNYLRFHYRKLFKSEYQPRPFCYAIRRPDHYPEGTLSIEAQLDDGALADPIHTTVCWSPAVRPMKFSIDASTQVTFNGDRFLHGWVSHQFSGYSGTNLSLVARARQFSSFILLVGTIVSAELFEPKYGIIIQNKDDLRIPLLLETIPTPKEFKDAIASLSPEQQRFAKGFRSMQLESTLFGVCVIQIKPQLEKLLNLPNDSLTKEIQLTQDLMSLFIEYQIPSDLISYSGNPNASVDSKVQVVKQYVTKMQAMIQKTKNEQLTVAQQQQQFRLAAIDSDEDSSHDEEEEKEECEEVKRPVRRMMKKDGGGGGGMKEKKSKEEGGEVAAASGKVAGAGRLEMRNRRQSQSAQIPQQKQQQSSTITASIVTKASSSAPSAQSPPSTTATTPPTKQTEDHQDTEDDSELQAVVDYTKIPAELESRFGELDVDGAVRPTIIKASNSWSKKFQKALLAAAESSSLGTDEQGKERNKTFDLLDALSKSGALSVDYASLHVVIASTHCFTNSLMNTVIQDNVNPIEKLERTSLIVASTIHQQAPLDLVNDEQVARVGTYSPMLIEHEQQEQEQGQQHVTTDAVHSVFASATASPVKK